MSATKYTDRPKPIKFSGASEMPYFTLSLATTEWNQTGTWRYLRPCYVERIPACQASCPTSNDIERWIGLLSKGRVQEAWDAATMENPFPAIMGRVCFHPCMTGCNRNELGGAVNINMLERCLGDAIEKGATVPKPFFKSSGKKVCVIGSGPAGLACAYHLRRLGHEVTVLEREEKAGGMLRYGIPAYRLPKNILDADIDRLCKMGIKFEFNKPVRDAAALQDLHRDYAAVFLATGAWRSRALGIPDDKAPQIMSGLEMLKMVGSGHKPNLGNTVIVVGGGNTALDSARTAKRLGCDVTIAYRRSQSEMPASEEEIRDALEEGIKLEILVAPKRIVMNEKRLVGVEFLRMKLGDPDESGRRKPVAVEGSEFIFNCDTVLTAIGEEIDNSIIPSALHIEHGSLSTNACGKTEWNWLFAGGDIIDGPRTVVDAMSSGKRSAIAIDAMLSGLDPLASYEATKIFGTNFAMMSRYLEHKESKNNSKNAEGKPERLNEVVKFEELNKTYFTRSEPKKTPAITIQERFKLDPFVEVNVRPSEDDEKAELDRCFHCGRCTLCDNCFIYCPDVAIAKKQDGFDIDLFLCKGCGVCTHECPRSAMKMSEEPMEF